MIEKKKCINYLNSVCIKIYIDNIKLIFKKLFSSI